MAYAFRFDCYEKIDNPDLDRWDRKTKSVDVTVVATSEAEAETMVKSLITRNFYDLEQIVELTELRPSHS